MCAFLCVARADLLLHGIYNTRGYTRWLPSLIMMSQHQVERRSEAHGPPWPGAISELNCSWIDQKRHFVASIFQAREARDSLQTTIFKLSILAQTRALWMLLGARRPSSAGWRFSTGTWTLIFEICGRGLVRTHCRVGGNRSSSKRERGVAIVLDRYVSTKNMWLFRLNTSAVKVHVPVKSWDHRTWGF